MSKVEQGLFLKEKDMDPEAWVHLFNEAQAEKMTPQELIHSLIAEDMNAEDDKPEEEENPVFDGLSKAARALYKKHMG